MVLHIPLHLYLYLGSCIDSEDDGSPEAMAGFMTGGDDADTGANTEGNLYHRW
ncbi:MAG: hypothetical protein R2784_17215 [Saprospiraceae bacterium]